MARKAKGSGRRGGTKGAGAKAVRRRAGAPAKRAASAPPAAPPPEATLAERAARALEEMRRRERPYELALLEDALDLRETLRTVAGAFVPGFADWCLVDLVDARGVPRRVLVAHADPRHALVAEEYRAVPVGEGWATPAAQAIRDRTPRLLSRLTEELMAWATWDDRHLAALRATSPNSLLAVPLVARGTAVGAVTLLRSGATPPFWGSDDVARAVALAAPAGLAVDLARRLAAVSGPGRTRRRP